MKTKQFLPLIAALLFTAVPVKSQTGGNDVVTTILSSYTARAFSDAPVADDALKQILECGIKAPSAMNSQPWKFTVVRDMAQMQKIVRDINEGNVLIIVSGMEEVREGINVDFDCALATENMYIAAQGLGLGSHIYMGPMRSINSTMKEDLGIPEGYRAVALLRIGSLEPGVDAVSSASSRNKLDDVVNYK